ncbi:HAP3 [[Candida] subhashii]|uniref:HAP3 n=1 Tax=[Candida] subhashii TaxID=561895 RepID=A0A8J5QW24_9ASCO|nr:HAP3 [[Candida] subhashii]KAG7665797.1 HAP3 [[Candida] subhashii]
MEKDIELREQDRWLPIANVARLMKNTLPQTAKVSKDAKECMQECVSEFISFITSEASDKCLREKRKTINGEDILFSMHDLGFENYAEVLKIYLAKYREQQALRQERGETRTTKKQAKQAAAQAAAIAAAASAQGIQDGGVNVEETVSVSVEQGSSSHLNEGDEVMDMDSELHGYAAVGTSATHPDVNMHSQQYEIHIDEQPHQQQPQAQQVQAHLHSSESSSIQSPESYYHDYNNGNNQDPSIKQEVEASHMKQETSSLLETNNTNNNPEQYAGYDDFLNHHEPVDGSAGADAGDDAASEHRIEELAKQLTNEDADIDALTAGITNGSDSYF